MITMTLQSGENWSAEQEDINQWKRTYCDINVEREMQKMASWLSANPAKRKTKAGMRRFINSWLSRANESGGSPEITKDDLNEVQTVGISAVERDDIYHKMTETFQLYGKTVSKIEFKIWMRAFTGKPANVVINAFDKYVFRGKYAPKPVDILEIIEEEKAYMPTPVDREKHQYVPPPENVRVAWAWYIAKFMAGGITLGVYKNVKLDIDDATAERYIHTVNEEAFRLNEPDAVRPEHKLLEIWGAHC